MDTSYLDQTQSGREFEGYKHLLKTAPDRSCRFKIRKIYIDMVVKQYGLA